MTIRRDAGFGCDDTLTEPTIRRLGYYACTTIDRHPDPLSYQDCDDGVGECSTTGLSRVSGAGLVTAGAVAPCAICVPTPASRRILI